MPRILIADDDAPLRQLLRMTLPENGFEVLEAGDGQEALDVIAVRPPDLLVLDWRMPGLGGADVLREVRRSHPDLRVIVLTVEGRPRQRAVAESLGADMFLTKPFSPLELLDAVERLLPLPE